MKLRIGIVGLGEDWEHRHAPALHALSERFRVVAVCDPTSRRARRVAVELNATHFDGFRALTEYEDLDAIFILSEKWFGELPLLAACESGKAVYCAAPILVDENLAEVLKQRVEQSGVTFVAEFPYRHAPTTLRLKELIATRLGKPNMISCTIRQGPSKDKLDSQNQAMTRLMHLIDWSRYVIGSEPISVIGFAHQGVVLPDVCDCFGVSLDFSSPGEFGHGPSAQLRWDGYFSSRWQEAMAFRTPAEMTVACENGIAFLDFPRKIVWFDDAGQHTESLESDRTVGEQLLLYFHRAVTSFLHQSGGAEDAYRALHIVHCAKKSYTTGCRIDLG